MTTSTQPLYRLTRDQLAAIFEDPSQPRDLRDEAMREFDAKTDAAEGR